MLFAWDVIVPANRPVINPVIQILKLTHGVITKMSVKFPAGCHGLVNIRLLHEESILLPLNKDTWITGDDETIVAEEYFELLEAPYQLKFIGNSPGTSYQHIISVRVTILPYWLAAVGKATHQLAEMFSRLVGY